MAHTPECSDANGAEWWPESAPTEIDVTTLPAAGSLSHPLRIPGQYPWLGIWGEFAGARIGISATESYQLRSGSAMPYPGRGLDIFLSADTGMWGKAQFARFKTHQAAMAWAGTNGFTRTASGPLGPFPAATPLADNDPNPTTTRIGANALGWNQATNSWDRVVSETDNADALGTSTTGHLAAMAHLLGFNGVSWDRIRSHLFADSIDLAAFSAAGGALLTMSGNMLLDTSKTSSDRWQTIPSGLNSGRAKTEDSWKSINGAANVALNSAGTVAQYTVPAGKIARGWVYANAGTALTAGSIFQIASVGNAIVGWVSAVLAAGNPIPNCIGVPVVLTAADTLQSIVTTGGGTGTVVLKWMLEERWAE